MENDNPVNDAGGGDDAPVETSRTDDIASAFEQIETRDAPASPPGDRAAPVDGPSPPAAPGGRDRGPDGRFKPGTGPTPPQDPAAGPGKPQAPQAPKPALAPGQRPPGAPQTPPDPAAAPAPQLRAPASWKPEAREHWAKLPPQVQQEVARRETEVARTLHESSRAREAVTHMQAVIGPYAQNIAASGSDPIGAIENFFKADNTLRHGSIAEKAQMAANIIKQYGIDIVTLDQVLAGQTPQHDPNTQMAEQLRREMQQQLQPVLGFFNQMQGQRQQAMQKINQTAGGEVEAFAQDAAHEFYDDVRMDMADIIDMFTARGQSISLQDAYDRAININPQISAIIAQRAETQRATANAQAAQRARRAAASLSGSPAPAGARPGVAGDDRRAEIEAAWDDSSGS